MASGEWRVALAMVLAAPVLLLLNGVAGRAYKRADEQAHAAAEEADTRVLEFAQAQPVLRAFGAVGAGNRALESALARQRSAYRRMVGTSVPGLIVFALAVQAVFLVLTYLVIGQVTGGSISAAAAIALIAVSARFIEPLDQAAQLGNGLRAASAAVDRVAALLAEPVLPEADSPVTPGVPAATDDELARAMRAARVDEIVQRLPDGARTRVGEGGAALSGGERQRVSIARALLKDAPIVLLDEATAALDPHSEAVVVRGVHEVTQGKTVIVVAHRLATIAHADQILFVDGGRIVERGTHADLLESGGRYADFWNERSRAAGWRLDAAAV